MEIFRNLKSRKKSLIVFLVVSIVSAAYFFASIPSNDNKFEKLAQDAIAGNSKARSVLFEAANSGKSAAQYYFGMVKHIDHDYTEAMSWLRKSSEQNYAEAEFRIGVMYARGEGVQKDNTMAVTWYRKAAEHGDRDSNYMIGTAYMKGNGVPKNSAKAADWFRRGADQGSRDAQFTLGAMYKVGVGVPLDLSKAVSWIRKSAEQGHPDAQLQLGAMYVGGDGVKLDAIQAYKWIVLSMAESEKASSVFNNGNRLLGALAKHMTQAQIHQATQEALKWRDEWSAGNESSKGAKNWLAEFRRMAAKLPQLFSKYGQVEYEIKRDGTIQKNYNTQRPSQKNIEKFNVAEPKPYMKMASIDEADECEAGLKEFVIKDSETFTIANRDAIKHNCETKRKEWLCFIAKSREIGHVSMADKNQLEIACGLNE